jgi:hypothetical protein
MIIVLHLKPGLTEPLINKPPVIDPHGHAIKKKPGAG